MPTIPHIHEEYKHWGIAAGERVAKPPAEGDVWYLGPQAASAVMRALSVGAGQTSEGATGNYAALLQAHLQGKSVRRNLF